MKDIIIDIKTDCVEKDSSYLCTLFMSASINGKEVRSIENYLARTKEDISRGRNEKILDLFEELNKKGLYFDEVDLSFY